MDIAHQMKMLKKTSITGATAAMFTSKESDIMTSFANILRVSAVLASLVAVPALAEDSNYTHRVFSKISTLAVYPRMAQVRDEEGVVTLALTIDRSGNVADVKVVDSSGVATIDQAAVQAARAAAPYPAPADQQAEVTGKIRFEL
jgi:TonB family protein